MELVKKEDISDVLVVVGGVIPGKDVPVLQGLGVKGIFPGGARFEEISRFIKENVKH
jgi:methylmalonyl-CoA mutase C-terminal domain/subunit